MAQTEPTFGGNAEGNSNWVVDTAATVPLGGACTGIGVSGADGAGIPGDMRIGGAAAGTIIEVDGNLGTP